MILGLFKVIRGSIHKICKGLFWPPNENFIYKYMHIHFLVNVIHSQLFSIAYWKAGGESLGTTLLITVQKDLHVQHEGGGSRCLSPSHCNYRRTHGTCICNWVCILCSVPWAFLEMCLVPVLQHTSIVCPPHQSSHMHSEGVPSPR